MSPAKALFLVTAALLSCASAPSPVDRPSPESLDWEVRAQRALVSATSYLVSQQSPDGSWRSSTYGAFKDGYSLSPVILSALLFAPDVPGLTEAYARGVDFVSTLLDADGQLRAGFDGPSYPLASLALTAAVLSVPANRRHLASRPPLLAELRRRQLVENNGFGLEDPSHGGFGYSVGIPIRPPSGLPPDDARAANLPATLVAVSALRFAGASPDDPALVAARGFILRCRNPDGGFFFSPTGGVTNKAGIGDDGRPRSYGSMTADGLRAMLKAGVGFGDPAVLAARTWLHQNFDASKASGAYPTDREPQREAVYFYAMWSMAHALYQTSGPELETRNGPIDWRRALVLGVLPRQRPDGSFANPATDLREDDPLLATPFAMAALALARPASTGRRETPIPQLAR